MGLSLLAGILAGLGATTFLYALEWATAMREAHPLFLFGLPVAGLVIGLIYHHLGQHESKGFNLALEEIHTPKKTLPLRMVPFVFLGSVLTHLTGGSAGREGAIIQTGAALSDQLSKFFSLTKAERKMLLVAGTGASFGAGIGAPLAGVVFGMEVLHIGKLKAFAWLECLLASSASYGVTLFLHAPHSIYPKLSFVEYAGKTFFVIILFGCLCGLLATTFTHLAHQVQKLFQKFLPYPPLRPFVGGLLLLTLFYLEGSFLYTGLGIPMIQEAMTKSSNLSVPFLKGAFTLLTIGTGFKGGEFIPLVFMGATLGSALSVLFRVSTQLLAALGFAAVFAGAANTPIACTIMAMELFGPKIGGYALLACFFSYYCSSHTGLYAAQRVLRRKNHRLNAFWKLLDVLKKKLRTLSQQ